MSWSGPEMRIGQGFDIHPFSDDPERLLVLGGVTFPGERGLVGHSDSCLLYTSPSPRDQRGSRMPSSA